MNPVSRMPIAAAAIVGAAVLLAMSPDAQATPSTQVWIPSPDIQKFGTLHINSDVYARPGKSTILMLGPTAGVLPFEKIQAEVGFDLMFMGNSELDANPLYFHGKVATPEDTWFKWSPSIAVGAYNIGTKPGLTSQNIAYGLAGRTFPVLGRLSAGYYYANDAVVVDDLGAPANDGLLLSWDRTMSEISDRLWLAVDYQSGQSALGALNFGGAWAFSDKASVLVGYDHYLNQEIAGKDTFTVQLDLNFF